MVRQLLSSLERQLFVNLRSNLLQKYLALRGNIAVVLM